MGDYVLIGCESFWKIEKAMEILREKKYNLVLAPDFEIREKAARDEIKAIVLSDQPCKKEHMDLFPNLKTIARVGTGYDNVDMGAAKELNILVTRISDVSAEAVSEYALGLILSFSRNIKSSHKFLACQNKWERNPGSMLSELKIGIVGLGAIGRKLAEKLNLLGAEEIFGWNRTFRQSVSEATAKYKVRLMKLRRLMAESDIVVLCLALNAGTRGIISKEMLSLMKPTGFLVNVARGALVDEGALVEALHAKKIAGAALDVFSKEPPLDELFFQKLQKLSPINPNVILTPHMANRTRNLLEDACVRVAENVISVLEGRLEGVDIVNYL